MATLGFQVGSKRNYAVEGSVFSTGATIQWLRDGLGIISNAAETSEMASLAESHHGVYFVPAFVGLGAPHWAPHATASITGMTRSTTKYDVVRAALESTAYQVADVIAAMESGRKRSHEPLRADGGQSANSFAMLFQSDILDRPVEVANVVETTARGAALLAGRGIGLWRSEKEINSLWQASHCYEPLISESERTNLRSGWLAAVERSSSII